MQPGYATHELAPTQILEEGSAVHVQIVTFKLNGVSEEDYRNLGDELAPAFAAVEGLHHKVWLANPSTNTFGGVYYWEDRAAMERYLQSELCNSVVTHPNLADIQSTDFEVMEGPTKVTRG
jgi:quinol monooxygenase YgiN